MNSQRDIKVVLLGESGVGKSNIVLRFVKDLFTEEHGASIGGSFMGKLFTYNNTPIKFKIWDTAGGEKYRSLAPMYYKDAQAALLVYDITDKASFQELKFWINELQKNGPPNICIEGVIVGNKIDLTEEEQVLISDADAYAKANSAFLKLSSAKEGKGVQEIFKKVAEEMLKREEDDDETAAVRRESKKLQSNKPESQKQQEEQSTCC